LTLRLDPLISSRICNPLRSLPILGPGSPAVQDRAEGAVSDVVNSPLTMVSDLEGALVLGFVNKEIFYMKFIGHVSAPLGTKGATLLRKRLANTPVLGFFCDAELPGTIDLSARSAIVRAFLDNRKHLESMATLVGTPIVAPTVRAIATVLDGLAHIAENADEFHSMLVRAAPYAQAKLPRDKWTRTMMSERPGRISARMRVAPRRS
jgi:hypothetical protein